MKNLMLLMQTKRGSEKGKRKTKIVLERNSEKQKREMKKMIDNMFKEWENSKP
jgi:hypothetical protein